LPTKAYAAPAASAPLAPFTFERRAPGPHDVSIELFFCGICHSDIHQARDEWGGAKFPMVPGHEMVGRVTATGAKVTKFKVGDLAGVGCMVDSCRTCDACKAGLEQFCAKGCAWSYNSTEMDKTTPTQGGYSSDVVCDEAYTLKLKEGTDLAAAAPLLCAGITTWSPLRHWKAGPGKKVGVVGLGGLGHIAVKLAASLGAEVTVFSTSKGKEQDARRLGATGFALSSEKGTFKKLAGTFDLILDTISAPHDYNAYLGTLRLDGAMVLLGVPPAPTPVAAGSLIFGRRSLAGSLIGGIAETQEMLDHCAKHGIVSDIELIPASKINEAYERTVKADVKYRFVVDLKTL
jgi:uncharacterized zinc-type alcohol dehydrogenase-like protein